jgi:hypothetical protein
MLRLKSCPRCKGDIFIDRDHLGWYEQCIQCGYQHDLKVSDEAKGHGKKVYMNTRGRRGLTTEVTK